ncbi:MAG: YdiY family protein [Gemmatimonadota bacterium]
MFRAIVRHSMMLALLGTAAARPIAAQDEQPSPGWSDNAELSFVLTAGNSESSSFGLRNTLARLFDKSTLKLDAGGIRVESGTTRRSAIGTGQNDFTVSESTDRETTAENYFAELRYDLQLSERTYVYASGGWTRNRFAGVDNRWTGAAGFGINLIKTDRGSFDVDLGLTVASEDRLIGPTESFGGLRFGWGYSRQLTESTAFASTLAVNENLSDTDDLRADFDNSIAVAISSVLALKTGVKILYDKQPALESIELFDAPGGSMIGTVVAPLDEVDTQVTVSLVVSL